MEWLTFYEQHVERAELYPVAGRDDYLLRVVYAVLAQFVVNERESELSAVDGRLYFAQKVGHAADMVLMPVRKQQPAHLAFVCDEIGDVGRDEVDARSSSVGKIMPASMIIMSSPYSIAVMFLPISPTPPRKIIFTCFSRFERVFFAGFSACAAAGSATRFARGFLTGFFSCTGFTVCLRSLFFFTGFSGKISAPPADALF